MAKLIYSTIASLDGYVADEDGDFDWAEPPEDAHAFVNDLERPVGTYLYGRRMYETMVYWETAHTVADQPLVEQDFTEIWQAAEKIVYSTTLGEVSSARTRIERAFDPEVIRGMKASAERDISVGGPDLAAQALNVWCELSMRNLSGRCPTNRVGLLPDPEGKGTNSWLMWTPSLPHFTSWSTISASLVRSKNANGGLGPRHRSVPPRW